MSSPEVMVILAVLLAIGLDIWLIVWIRHDLQRRGLNQSNREQGVFVLGRFSPLLTWLKNRRLPSTPQVSPQPGNPPAIINQEVNPSAAATLPLPSLETFSQEQANQPVASQMAEHARSERRALLIELTVLVVAVWAFCLGFLNFDADMRLPGNEAEIFQSLDWTLVNSLKDYHQFPLWNPYLHTGLPYIADPMLHLYNPVVTLPVLIFGVQSGFKLALFLSYVLAAFGMWRLGAVLGMGRAARLWVALMYAFAGQPAGRFFQGQYLFVLGFAWIPWAVGYLLLLVKTRRRLHAGLAVLSLALVFFSGNVYYAFYLLLVAVLFTLVMVTQVNKRRPFFKLDLGLFRWLALVAVLVLGLIAVQFLPLNEFRPRMSKSMDLAGSHTPWQLFLDYVSKDSYREDAYEVMPAREEFYAYIGVIPILGLGLLPLAWWRRDKRTLLFAGLILVLVILWADLDRMPWRQFFINTDFLLQFRHLLRILIFGSFALFLLSGLGIDTLWKQLNAPEIDQNDGHLSRWHSRLAVASLGVLALLLGYSVGDVFLTNRASTRLNEVHQPAYIVSQWLRQSDPGEYYVRRNPNNGWHDALIASNLRFLDAWYHFGDIRDLSRSLTNRPVQAQPNYLVQSETEPVPAGSGAVLVAKIEGYPIYRLPHSLPFAFSVANSELAKDSQAGMLQRENVTPQIPYIRGPNGVEVIADGQNAETLVVLVTHYPGWKVSVDRRETVLKNIGGYLGVDLLPGVHQYVFSFQPRSFYFGLATSLFFLGLTVYLIASDLGQERQVFRNLGRSVRTWLISVQARLAQVTLKRQKVVDATYQSAGFKLDQPLELAEDSRVKLTVEALPFPPGIVRPALRRWIWATLDLVGAIVRPLTLDRSLLAFALVVYLLTRLIGLADFPIYFFTDEAVQTVMAADFVQNGLQNSEQEFLPTYFSNGPTFNLSSISVYLQVIPYLLFGKSVFATRAVSVIVSAFGALAVGLILRDILKVRFWWSGVLLLSIAPAWFLHSRTAFETVEMASFYAGFLYFYLLYRYKAPRFLYPALILGALTFYTYSPGQLLIVLTGLLLLITDLRYHWQNRAVALRGLLLLGILVLPYLRYYLGHPQATLEHLATRAPYWLQPIPFSEKLGHYFSEYLSGLNPAYWYLPNERDLSRHLMKGYGHLSIYTLPFAALGLLLAIRNIKSPAYRTVLITLLVAPAGSALVEVGITRLLVLIIPITLLTAVGLIVCLEWLQKLVKRWVDSRSGGKVARAANMLTVSTPLSLGLFCVLAVTNFSMLRDALVNGPTWFRDYSLGGMQYGARQLFGAAQEYLQAHPGTRLIVSPSWSNGTDVVARFFLAEDLPVQLGSIEGHLNYRLPLGEDMVFVMIPVEFEKVLESGKFQNVRVDKTLFYPNGEPGFYFVRLQYTADIDRILAEEKEQRRQLQETTLAIEGQDVKVEYSLLDMGEIYQIVDGDSRSVVRTFEANPFILRLTFPEPRQLSALALIVGSTQPQVTARLYPSLDSDPVESVRLLRGTVKSPEVEIQFDEPVMTRVLYLEIYDPNSPEPAHIHLWELKLR